MLKPSRILRRLGGVRADERTGDAYTAARRAAAHRDRDAERALARRGPH